MKKFPASIPRKVFRSEDVGGHLRCPECGGALASEGHSYVVAVREHGEMQILLVGNDDGYFCEACPVVVLDSDAFAELVLLAIGRESSGQFAVLGIVDLEAVPKEKRSVPFREDDNPIPLVEFIRPGERKPRGRRGPKSRSERPRSRRRKKRRK